MRDVLEFWVQLHSHPEIEISFKFIPKILMSKDCLHFIGPLFIYKLHYSNYVIVKVNAKQSHYKPDRPRGFQEVKVPRFLDNDTGLW
jgi:hypothetical protein